MDISVVVPVKDEEQNVAALHKKLLDVLPRISKRFEIIFVDDGSRDRTLEVLKRLKKLKIIKFRKNFGQTAALAAGFEEAKGKLVVSIDGDLQNDPEDIPRMVRMLKEKGLDCVCGWRANRKDTISKKYLSVFARELRRFLIGRDVHDYGCTLRVYRKECLQDLDLMGEMHRYIPPMLRWKGFRIGELKVRHHKRKHGKTKYSYGRLVKGFLDMFNVWFWRKYSGRPMHIFGGMGIMSIIIGFLIGLFAIYEKIFNRVDLSDTFLPVLSVFAVIVGIQLFVSGILGDIAIKTYFKNGNKNYNIEKIIKRR